jgi:hypothetical protein
VRGETRGRALRTLDFIGYRGVWPQEYSRVEHVEHVERFWKQLKQLVKTTSTTPRNKRGDLRAPRGFAARKRNRLSLDQIVIYMLQCVS